MIAGWISFSVGEMSRKLPTISREAGGTPLAISRHLPPFKRSYVR
jgi:hypothetical protein